VSSGSYLLSGHDGPYAVERFVCGEEPAGWRYVGRREDPGSGTDLGRIDLLADAGGRILRLEVAAGGWLLRGGVVGAEAIWRRGDEERSEPAHGFTGTSPAYAIAAIRLAAAAGGSARLRLVAVHDGALATSAVDANWLPAGEGEWTVDDVATGQRRQLHVRDDLVVAGSGIALTQI
jgi:hypothetical protein